MSRSKKHAAVAGYSLVRNAALGDLTTFRVPARAASLAKVTNTEAIPEALREAATYERSVFVLGGGSNVLFTRDFDGLVLRLATRGIEILDEEDKAARVRVAAGESWDGFVRHALSAGCAGLENLILIPGNVGAAPIQNIGAYGVELSEFVPGVEAWDQDRGKFVRLSAEDCAFGYRDSIFKQLPGRYVLTMLELRLPRRRQLRLDYAGVREELAAMGVVRPEAKDVAHAVERLRLRKLPNPAEIGNAGSFFKNPLVSPSQAESLKGHHAGLPVYPAHGGKVKISAAWLIEACGYKGHREGDAGVSDKHALVLVNHGNATGADIWALAERIRDGVAERFGVILEPEPVIL
ncbi:MAG: UDP-N-acetylmuramate dehydrogenase [Gammaproteobacteria bacterium]